MIDVDALDRCSDEELMARLRRGRRESFGVLVRRYQKELFGYLRRYLRDADLAEDVFQLTFVQVFSKAAQFEPGRRFRPWMYAIAGNQAIDALRRTGRHPTVSLDQIEVDSEGENRSFLEYLVAREADPLENVAARERRDFVRASIDALPGYLRQTLILAYYQGLKYQEIAEILSIPVGTVKSRLNTALAKLHEMMVKDPSDAE